MRWRIQRCVRQHVVCCGYWSDGSVSAFVSVSEQPFALRGFPLKVTIRAGSVYSRLSLSAHISTSLVCTQLLRKFSQKRLIDVRRKSSIVFAKWSLGAKQRARVPKQSYNFAVLPFNPMEVRRQICEAIH